MFAEIVTLLIIIIAAISVMAIIIAEFRLRENRTGSPAFKQVREPREVRPKRPGETRISRIDFRRTTHMRRPVRDYTTQEDGNDPQRGLPE